MSTTDLVNATDETDGNESHVETPPWRGRAGAAVTSASPQTQEPPDLARSSQNPREERRTKPPQSTCKRRLGCTRSSTTSGGSPDGLSEQEGECGAAF
ncbi:uncharacterized protein BDZ99DRAFT_253414 [Mytilinidion resinicola]|uniref:Uncharacterized protein n=1 Tax=Mytilinidion resinicola TaxID=574789 RepID=A0A6A6YXZ7_9PEZI|nr:uncharacterized protein BDZ99DRAFT_253414 [Mytilinidion resinicola]KAF2813303.1 hypothetical protein BDZ99DRAFT_253414 [Mytilinidion resinicola]